MIYASLAIYTLYFSSIATKQSAFGDKDTGNLFFYETFDSENVFSSGKWIKSLDPKYVNQPVQIGSSKPVTAGFENDNGIKLTQEMKFYGFGSKFTKPFNVKNNKEVVLLYDLKLEEDLNCGGAYIKLPRVENFDFLKLNSDTPYSIMFGPDNAARGRTIFFSQGCNLLHSRS